MSWWTLSKLHPKTKSRFIVQFGTGLYLPNVKTITKPSVEVATKEYRLMNHFFNYPGLVKWQPIKITFVDMNGTGDQFDTSQMLYEMLTNSGYIHPTVDEHGLGKKPIRLAARSPISTPEKASTIANSFGDGLWSESNYSPEEPNTDNRTIRIQQIDFGKTDRQGNTTSKVIEQWELVNPLITNISWGELDYSADDLIECTLDIKYDWAEYTKDAGEPIISSNYQDFSK